MAAFPPRTQERGRAYAAEGRARLENEDDEAFTGVVRGSDRYLATWSYDPDTGWDAWCTCPVGDFCKHSYALACVYIGEGEDPGERRAPPARAAGNRAAASDPLRQLREARAEWERQSALDELLSGAPVLGLSPYTPPLLGLLRERDPDLLCWRLAEAIPPLAGGWLPPALESYQQRPDLAARFLERERALLANELLGWAHNQAGDGRRRLRLLFDVVTEPGAEPGLVFEARVTTPRLTDAPRTIVQLQQLRADLARAPGGFPPVEADVLAWLADNAFDAIGIGTTNTRLYTRAPLALLERVANSDLARWSTSVALSVVERGGVVPGGSVALGRDAARLVPDCVERDGGLWIELRVVWPDGTRRRLDEALLLPSPTPQAGRAASMVIANGVVSAVAEQPPPALFERFRTLGGLPVAREERAELVESLAARFPHLESIVAAHTRVYPATASIALDLRSDDWLQVRVFAHSGDGAWQPGAAVGAGAALFEYGAERGWTRAQTAGLVLAEPITAAAVAAAEAAAAEVPPAVAAPADAAPAADDGLDVWTEGPADESVGPALAWLDALPLTAGTRLSPTQPPNWEDRAVGWWMRASRRSMETLADVWAKRPEGVAFFGNDRARRLLGRGRALAPRLRVVASGVDWLSISAEWEAEGRGLSAADLTKLREATSRFVRLESGWVSTELGAEQDEMAQALAELGIEADSGGEQRLTVWQLAGASQATIDTLMRFGGDPETLVALERIREQVASFNGIPSIALPPGLAAELRPYQRHGLDFLANASTLGIGAVLADDMGLGKTVQALAWLLHQRATDPAVGPTLVVCPASVVHNWAREAARFAPALRVLLLTSGKTRHTLREEIPNYDLVVTNYALLRRDLEAWRTVDLHAAILDEAQFIKNPDAAVTRAARELRARHRLALTGTPLENRALDLWSICSFVAPGYLGNRAAFAARFDRADAPAYSRTLLSAKLRPLLLRRTKRAVAPELPPRIEERLDCELTREQRQLYVAELQRSRALLAKADGAPGGLNTQRISILAALTRLRQICCHPQLAGGRAGLSSGKFEALFEMLEPLLAEGHKVLVFSQFVQCLKLLAADLRQRGLAYHMLTGQTTKREQVVAAFQNDPDPSAFLISLKAGGTGLNLTAASYVVLFDPWWNPAVEAQAIDRTHRIGQDRTVIAYRMLTRGTIEEKIWELQQRKAALADEVLGEGGFARALTRDDLEFLLTDIESDVEAAG